MSSSFSQVKQIDGFSALSRWKLDPRIRPNRVMSDDLPIPGHFDPESVGSVWNVDYGSLAPAAHDWREDHDLSPAAEDERSIGLVLIDVQNTFCMPDYELFVAGRSGTGAVDDNRRLCRFLYRNLGAITRVYATLDTHQPIHIFHRLFLVDADGNHPEPMTQITHEDVIEGRWRFNEKVAESLGIDPEYGQEHLEHYTRSLADDSKFELTVWPYHSMLGGLGHAMVPAVHEAVFFHSVARYAQPEILIKGRQPLTENYSALGPEVETGPDGTRIGEKNELLVRAARRHDALIVAGQAQSHCLNWTVSDLIDELEKRDPALVGRLYLLEDCTSPVVIPDVVDYTDAAEAAFDRFEEAGAHRVSSETPIDAWLEQAPAE